VRHWVIRYKFTAFVLEHLRLLIIRTVYNTQCAENGDTAGQKPGHW
jgi:hypothetical protein